MIKTLLNADEEPPPGTKVVVEETVLNPPLPLIETQVIEENPAEMPIEQVAPVEENALENPATESFEIPGDAKFFNREPEKTEETVLHGIDETPPLDEDSESLTELMSKIENLEPEEFDRLEAEIKNAEINEPAAETLAAPAVKAPVAVETAEPLHIETEKTNSEAPEAVVAPLNTDWLGKPLTAEETTEKTSDASEPTIFQSDYTPPTTAETIRNSGLAWSAGIVFFGAVIFMMIFGWFADLLFGSSPFGLVGGIILGGIIGFIQFFRITSQIFKK